MMDFAEFKALEQKRISDGDNNDDTPKLKPKAPELRLNGKDSIDEEDGTVYAKGMIATTKKPLAVRFVPYPDRPYSFDYRICWVSLTQDDGSQKNLPLIFPMEPKEGEEDKLVKLIKEIVHVNYLYRKNLGNQSEKDIVPLQVGSKFHGSLRTTHTVQVCLLKTVDENGKPLTQEAGYAEVVKHPTTGKNYPVIHRVNLTDGAYKNLAEKVQSAFPYSANGKALEVTSFANFGIVTSGETVTTTLGKGSEQTSSINFDVHERPFIKGLPPYWADKDEEGKFIYMDNPEDFNKPTKEANPSRYEQAYAELKQRLDQYKATQGGQNPYVTPGHPTSQQAPADMNFAGTGAVQGNPSFVNPNGNQMPTNSNPAPVQGPSPFTQGQTGQMTTTPSTQQADLTDVNAGDVFDPNNTEDPFGNGNPTGVTQQAPASGIPSTPDLSNLGAETKASMEASQASVAPQQAKPAETTASENTEDFKNQVDGLNLEDW